jgi:hypothetical protein
MLGERQLDLLDVGWVPFRGWLAASSYEGIASNFLGVQGRFFRLWTLGVSVRERGRLHSRPTRFESPLQMNPRGVSIELPVEFRARTFSRERNGGG